MLHRTLSFATLTSLFCVSLNAHAVSSAELYRASGEDFGKFEARIYFAQGDGIISSFFLWKDGSEKSDVYWNELDFEKLGAQCELQTNSIYGLPQTNHEKHHAGLSGLCDGYHTYTYEWTPDYISWAVDGVELRRDTGPDAQAYADNASTDGLQMRFNVWPGNASFGGTFVESSLPVYQYVDWAQYSTYTPGSGDAGSDFTLSWRDDFDTLSGAWLTGSWDSPLGLSTHSAANIKTVNGVAVLALTADDATGYSGTPPVDNATGSGGDGGDANGAGGAAPAAGGAALSAGGSTAPGATGGTGTPPSRLNSGCIYAGSPARRGTVPLWGIIIGMLGLCHRLLRMPKTVSGR